MLFDSEHSISYTISTQKSTAVYSKAIRTNWLRASSGGKSTIRRGGRRASKSKICNVRFQMFPQFGFLPHILSLPGRSRTTYNAS